MRLSEFWTLMERHFGRGYAAVVASSHTLGHLDHRTAEQAIEDGEKVRAVWEAIVADFDVPPEHQLPPEPRRR